MLDLRKDPAIENARLQIEWITEKFFITSHEKPDIEDIKAKWQQEILEELWEIAEQYKPRVEKWVSRYNEDNRVNFTNWQNYEYGLRFGQFARRL